ncbi:MAG: DUF4935 domain-containing protein [Spirochaetes bacterium]|nr:DUF4935 domain-containing protein [Spirochaetota bacterium]
MKKSDIKYGAITIDTSIFDQKGLNFESGILKTLEQFKGKPIPLILSEIVIKEVQSHLMRKVMDARKQLMRAIDISKLHLLLNEEKISGYFK